MSPISDGCPNNRIGMFCWVGPHRSYDDFKIELISTRRRSLVLGKGGLSDAHDISGLAVGVWTLEKMANKGWLPL